MKINFQLLLILAFAISFTACDTGETATATGTMNKFESGTEYLTYKALSTETAQPGDFVFFHAQMRNDSSVLNKSRDSGQESPRMQIPTEVIPGRPVNPMIEVLQVMGVGDSVTLVVQLDTVPANQRPKGFETMTTLYYDVVCLKIQKPAEAEAEALIAQQKQAEKVIAMKGTMTEVEATVAKDLVDYKAGTAILKTTDSGLKYIVHEEGTGTQSAAGKNVSVHYYGCLLDGKKFDSSYERGATIDFVAGTGRVIQGWDEILTMLKAGSKVSVFIPSELAYGERGSGPNIPPNSELMFYMHLVDVK